MKKQLLLWSLALLSGAATAQAAFFPVTSPYQLRDTRKYAVSVVPGTSNWSGNNASPRFWAIDNSTVTAVQCSDISAIPDNAVWTFTQNHDLTCGNTNAAHLADGRVFAMTQNGQTIVNGTSISLTSDSPSGDAWVEFVPMNLARVTDRQVFGMHIIHASYGFSKLRSINPSGSFGYHSNNNASSLGPVNAEWSTYFTAYMQYEDVVTDLAPVLFESKIEEVADNAAQTSAEAAAAVRDIPAPDYSNMTAENVASEIDTYVNSKLDAIMREILAAALFDARIEEAAGWVATISTEAATAVRAIAAPDYSTMTAENATTEIDTYVNSKLDEIIGNALAAEDFAPVRLTNCGKLPSREYITYTPEQSDKLNRSTTASNANVWKLCKQDDGSFKIKLSSDNVWLATIAGQSAGMQVVTDENEAGTYQISIANYTNGYFHIQGMGTNRYIHSNNGTVVVAYTGNGTGSQWTITTLTPDERLTELVANAEASASLVSAASASGLWKQEEIDAFTAKITEAINDAEVNWSTVTDVEAKLTEIENSFNAPVNEVYGHLHGRRYRFNSANPSHTSRYMQANADNVLIAGAESTAPLSAIWQLQFTEESGDCRTVRLYNPVRRQYINGTNNRASLTDDKEQETTIFTISFRPETNKLGFHSQPRNNYLNLDGSNSFNSFAWYNFDPGSSFTATPIDDDYTTQITDEMLTTLAEIGDNHKATVEAQEPGDYLTADVVTMKEAYADYATEANNNDAICIKFFYDTAIANRAWPCFQLVYYGNKVDNLEAGSRALADLGHGSYPCHGATDKFDLRQAWTATGSSSKTVSPNVAYDFKNLETSNRIFHTANGYDSWRYSLVAYNDGTDTYRIAAANNNGTAQGNGIAITEAESSSSSAGTNLSSQYVNNENSKWKFVYLGTDKALSTMISKSETWRSDAKAETRTQFAEAKELAHPTDKSFGTRLGQYNREGLADDVTEFDRLSSSIVEFDFDEFATLYTTLSTNAPTLNMPADGTYLRAQSAPGSTWSGRDNAGAKLYYNTTVHDNRICLTKGDVTDDSDLFIYKNGRLTAVNNGMNLHIINNFPNFPANVSDNAAAAESALGAITFVAGNNQPGTYELWAVGNNNAERHFHANSNHNTSTDITTYYIDCCSGLGSGHSSTDRSHNWTLTQVDTLTVNVIGDSDFGSFYCATPMTPVAVEGTVYYYGLNKLQNDTTEHREIVFTRLEPGTVVPEGYVVVFEAPTSGYGKLRKPLAGESAIEADADQAFQGSHIARVHTATEGNVTFAHVPAPATTEPAAAPKRVNVVAEEGTPHVANMTVYPVADGEALPANAMVVTLPKESNLINKNNGTATFSVGDQSKNQITTGLDRIVMDNGDGTCVIYDLQGRKLAAPVRGRVNIINGHKVYVK